MSHALDYIWSILRRSQVLCVALFLVLTCGVHGAPTLDSFMSFTSVTYLTKAPKQDRLAWVEHQSGISSIIVAEKSTQYTPRKITQYTDDNCIELTGLIFSSDGNYIYYTEGPTDDVNPLSLTVPPRNRIIRIPFNNNKDNDSNNKDKFADNSLYMAEGVLSAVSPIGEGAALYSTGQSVFEAFLNGTQVDRTLLFSVQSDQGYITDLTYSPSGTKIAFTSARGDHSFIGVYSVGDSKIKWISPSFDSDQSPVWSNDEQFIAFYRIRPLDDENGRTPIYGYSVYISQLSTGITKEVFRDYSIGFPATYGYGDRPLEFISSSEVVFQSEVSGWLHVTVGDFNNPSAPRDITKGLCEVQDFVGDPVNNVVYVANNCKDLDAVGISRVSASNGAFVDIIPGDIYKVSGINGGGSGMVVLSDGIAFIQTTVKQSTTVNIFNSNGSTIVIPHSQNSGKFDPSTWVTPIRVTMPSLDGLFTLHGQLFVPPKLQADAAIYEEILSMISGYNFDEKTYQKKNVFIGNSSAVLFTHGGPMRQMYCAMHYEETYALLYAQNQFLAVNGYYVFSLNYRLGVGYGKKFRDCTNCSRWGAAEYIDILGAHKFLSNLPDINPRNIGLYGLSYGGLNTLQGLARNSDLFAVGVANAPVFNWLSQSRFEGSILFDLTPQMPYLAIRVGPEPDIAGPLWFRAVTANTDLAYSSSPASLVKQFTSPVLLIQGDSDRDVDIQESMALYKMLQRQNSAVKALMFPNENHGLCLYGNQLIAAQETFNYLSMYLNK